MVEIYGVQPGSPAERAGLQKGDYLLSVNGHNITDVLDYSFYLTERVVRLQIHRGPELFEVTIKKQEYADIGLEFETFLMDKKRSCRNKCVFCFIDQLPPGMREPLYFKDDDSRLSFLQGNYVTLTNLSEEEIERIAAMKMSPINISVHTTNPELRCQMLHNKNAGKVLDIMRRFAEANITMNAQIVLCRSLNDGAELIRTMNDLAGLYPHVASVSIVPVGLTKYREGLYPLEPFSPAECASIIRRVEAKARECKKQFGTSLFFCGDEMYLKAGLPLHGDRYYEDFSQIENGVGMIASMKKEFHDELKYLDDYPCPEERTVSIATGAAAYDFISSLAGELEKRREHFHCTVYRIENAFFGPNVTVAGLITGGDLCGQLEGKSLGEMLFLPSVMLRADGEVFLDDMTPAQVSARLGVPLHFCPNDGGEFVRALLSEPVPKKGSDRNI